MILLFSVCSFTQGSERHLFAVDIEYWKIRNLGYLLFRRNSVIHLHIARELQWAVISFLYFSHFGQTGAVHYQMMVVSRKDDFELQRLYVDRLPNTIWVEGTLFWTLATSFELA